MKRLSLLPFLLVCPCPVQSAVFRLRKPLAKLLLLLLLDDVYMPIMATSKGKEIPVAERPFLTLGRGRGRGGRELHIVIDFNAFHC